MTLHVKELEPLHPVEHETPTINAGDDGHPTTAPPAFDLEGPQGSPSNGSYLPDEPRPSKPTPVSGDVILPLMIYAVVKSNPPRLLSHLLYTQRFRNESFGGEESYCLINLLAAAEFVENVDLAALGLQTEGVDTSDLTPLPVARSRSASVGSVDVTTSTIDSKPGTATRLRGRVEQQVDAIAGSANKVLSGVVDSSFGVLRALLPGGQTEQNVSQPPEVTIQEPKPGFGLLKRETGFSIATLAAALPIARQRSNQSSTTADESGQQMTEVSRPSSGMSGHFRVGGIGDDIHESSEESEVNSEEEADEEDDEEHDRRSIKSFESMMSQRKRRRRKAATARRSLADRLANVPGLQKTHESKPSSDAKVNSTNSISSQPQYANLNSPIVVGFNERDERCSDPSSTEERERDPIVVVEGAFSSSSPDCPSGPTVLAMQRGRYPDFGGHRFAKGVSEGGRGHARLGWFPGVIMGPHWILHSHSLFPPPASVLPPLNQFPSPFFSTPFFFFYCLMLFNIRDD